MTRFSNSKVYKLINSVDSKIYVGSTTQPLSKRLMDHKSTAKKSPSFVHKHFNKIGWDKVRIVLIETVNCFNKEQLNQREQHWIDLLKPSLNKQSAYVYCPHCKVHSVCKDCGGASICIHNIQKHTCKMCKGSHICKHDIQKHTCKICGGADICEHKKQKRTCKICNPIHCQYCDITIGKSLYKIHLNSIKHLYNFIYS